MKKILFFHHNSKISGAGVSGRNVLRSIDKNEYDVSVYCNTSRSDEVAKYFEEEQVKVIKGGASPQYYEHCVGCEHHFISLRHAQNIIKLIKDKPIIERTISECKPDIVILNSMTLFWIAPIAKKYNCKVILFFRETWIHGLLGARNSYIQKTISKYVDNVAYISNFDRMSSKLVTCNSCTIYNAIDKIDMSKYKREVVRKELNLHDDTFNLLYVGGMAKLKGIDVVLRAMPLLQKENRNVRLIVVGYEKKQAYTIASCSGIMKKIRYIIGTDYERQCLDIIKKNNLDDHIKFFPASKEIEKYYSACDAIVFPMTKPHQARPVFEAGMAKIPCIISDFDNIHEFANDSTCYLFEPCNPQASAKAITDLLDNEKNTVYKVENNYVNTINRHSIDIYRVAINELIKKVDTEL